MTKVFVSSTFVDLYDYRQAVTERIRQVGALDICMEHMGAREDRPTVECMKLISDSDIFIGIYAHRYGFVPKGEICSITELEYNAASARGIKRLIYIVDDNVPWLRKNIDRGPNEEQLNQLKDRLRSDHVVKYFSSKDDLAASVAADLGRELAFKVYRRANTRTTSTRTLKSIEDWSDHRTGIYKRNRNVFLVHTLRPSIAESQTYDIALYLIPHHSNDIRYIRAGLADVVGADFFMGRHFGNKVFRVQNTGDRIGIVVSAYGPFLCLCRVQYRDGDKVMLSRYIDFEMGQKTRLIKIKTRRTKRTPRKISQSSSAAENASSKSMRNGT